MGQQRGLVVLVEWWPQQAWHSVGQWCDVRGVTDRLSVEILLTLWGVYSVQSQSTTDLYVSKRKVLW